MHASAFIRARRSTKDAARSLRMAADVACGLESGSVAVCRLVTWYATWKLLDWHELYVLVGISCSFSISFERDN